MTLINPRCRRRATWKLRIGQIGRLHHSSFLGIGRYRVCKAWILSPWWKTLQGVDWHRLGSEKWATLCLDQLKRYRKDQTLLIKPTRYLMVRWTQIWPSWTQTFRKFRWKGPTTSRSSFSAELFLIFLLSPKRPLWKQILANWFLTIIKSFNPKSHLTSQNSAKKWNMNKTFHHILWKLYQNNGLLLSRIAFLSS